MSIYEYESKYILVNFSICESNNVERKLNNIETHLNRLLSVVNLAMLIDIWSIRISFISPSAAYQRAKTYFEQLLVGFVRKSMFESTNKNISTVGIVEMVQSTSKNRSKVFVKEPDFESSFRPFYYFSRILGTMPFSITYDSHGQLKGPKVRVHDAVWVTISICAILFVLLNNLNKHKYSIESGYPLILNLSFILERMMMQMGRIFMMVMDLFNRRKIVDILKMFQTFDREVTNSVEIQIWEFLYKLEFVCLWTISFVQNRWFALEFPSAIRKSIEMHWSVAFWLPQFHFCFQPFHILLMHTPEKIQIIGSFTSLLILWTFIFGHFWRQYLCLWCKVFIVDMLHWILFWGDISKFYGALWHLVFTFIFFLGYTFWMEFRKRQQGFVKMT